MNGTSENDLQAIHEGAEVDNVEDDLSVYETVIDYSENLRLFNNNCVYLGCALLLVIGIVSGILLGRLFNGIFRD